MRRFTVSEATLIVALGVAACSRTATTTTTATSTPAATSASPTSTPTMAAQKDLVDTAVAAGSQAFTEGIGGALFGTGELRGDLAKAAGWVINLAVAEWVIRRRPARRRPRHATAYPPAGALG